MTKKTFIEKWDEKTDKERLKFLVKKNGDFKFRIEVDNDVVIVIIGEGENDWVEFNEFGYDLLVQIFQFMDFDADYC